MNLSENDLLRLILNGVIVLIENITFFFFFLNYNDFHTH